MKKVLQAFLPLWLIAYMLCVCGDVRPPVERISCPVPETVAVTEPVLSLSWESLPLSGAEPASAAGPLQISESASNVESSPTASPLPTSTVYSIEYFEYLSAVFMLPEMEDHGEYLAEDLCCYDLYQRREENIESVRQSSSPLESGDGAGEEHWDFRICLPQFKDTLPCHSQLNSYFEELYGQLIPMKESFYYEYDYELNNHYNVYESYSYQGMTMWEHYLTVNMIKTAYYGGIRDAIIPMPITFDLDTGEPVTLPEILNCSEEQIEELVADCIYDYFLSQGDEYYSWKGKDTYLCYEPQYFYMLEQGLGVYYPRYSIDCGAAGDFLFVIPYEELYGKVPEDASFSP